MADNKRPVEYPFYQALFAGLTSQSELSYQDAFVAIGQFEADTKLTCITNVLHLIRDGYGIGRIEEELEAEVSALTSLLNNRSAK